MIGFETIGNATATFFDNSKPVLSTDPWIDGSPYFGSWSHKYNIPYEQKNNIINSKYIWFSHGHPDHLDEQTIQYLNNSCILVPDHYGDRIYNHLRKKMNCIKLKSNSWFQISKNIRIKSFSDWNQDASILIDILSKDIIFDQNDGKSLGWSTTIKNIVKNYKNRFLLKLACWGDADMINIYDNDNKFIKPYAALQPNVGEMYSASMKNWNCNFSIPFSSLHQYARTDSILMNKFTTPLNRHNDGFNAEAGELLPAFIRWDSEKSSYEKINPTLNKITPATSESLGDSWSDVLEKEDKKLIENYFRKIEHMKDKIGSIVFNVGNKDFVINFSKKKEIIRFSAPKNSLVTAIKNEIFDDMLIGNFMKTQLINIKSLYPDFTPYVAKYADNGIAKNKFELSKYFKYYKLNSADYWRDFFLSKTEGFVRKNFSTDSPIYNAAKVIHKKFIR